MSEFSEGDILKIRTEYTEIQRVDGVERRGYLWARVIDTGATDIRIQAINEHRPFAVPGDTTWLPLDGLEVERHYKPV